jgi:transcriptional regulator with XRE-family HTH domain
VDRPPEAAIIQAKRTQMRLSIREAARRAGISEGSWRRTESPGHRTRTATTVALMAEAVGVTAAELELAGRGDAARKLGTFGPRRGGSYDEIRDSARAAVRRLEDEARRLRAVLGDDEDEDADAADGDPRRAG